VRPWAAPAEGSSGLSPRALWRKALRALSNLPLAIGELAVLAGLSAIGTVIEQNKSYEYYLTFYPNSGPNVVLGFVTADLIEALAWDHMYSSPAYLGLLALLAASLAACTTTRQWPVAKVAQKWAFKSSARAVAAGADIAESLPGARLGDLGSELSKRRYQVFVKDGRLYAFRGLVGRLAPIAVHAAMLLSMAGFVEGAVGGWDGNIMAPTGGEFVAIQPLSPASPIAGAPRGADAVVRVDDFRIDYRANGEVSQFYSDLSVLSRDGEVLQRKTISVNDPLRFGDIVAYQTDWGIAGITVRAQGVAGLPEGPFTLPMAALEGSGVLEGRAWGSFLPTGERGAGGEAPPGVSLIARDLQSVAVYDEKGAFVGVRRPGSGKPIAVGGVELVVEGMTGSTGLQIKADPGIPLVYAGFALMIVSGFLSVLPFNQVHALLEGTTVHVGGRTNRGRTEFVREMDEVLESVPEITEAAA